MAEPQLFASASGYRVALREWAEDARKADAAWNTLSAAQKDLVLRRLVVRFGRLCTGLADIVN